MIYNLSHELKIIMTTVFAVHSTNTNQMPGPISLVVNYLVIFGMKLPQNLNRVCNRTFAHTVYAISYMS